MSNLLKKIPLAAFAAGLSLVITCDAQARKPGLESLVTISQIRSFLNRRTDVTSLQNDLTKWKGAPLYQRVALLDFLVGSLSDVGHVETINYEWKQGSNDKNHVAGRAAWALEEILGAKLMDVIPTSSDDDLSRIHGDAERLVSVYREGILTLASEYEVGGPPDELKASYAGKIGLSAVGAIESAVAMGQLLEEWFPVGKKLDTLEAILGFQGTRSGKQVEFRFDSGFLGIAYHFIVVDGVIISVAIHGFS
jgi:hypothetical protein